MKRLAAQLGSHADKAQAVVNALRALTPQLVQWDRQLRQAVESQTMRTWQHPSGRLGYFNHKLPHKSLNTVVQGYGRELLVDAMLRWEAKHPGYTVVPIHDELVVQCESELAEQYTEDLVACMTTAIGEGAARVPIVAEADPPTRRWGTVE